MQATRVICVSVLSAVLFSKGSLNIYSGLFGCVGLSGAKAVIV